VTDIAITVIAADDDITSLISRLLKGRCPFMSTKIDKPNSILKNKEKLAGMNTC
jgi:hypothetical protein